MGEIEFLLVLEEKRVKGAGVSDGEVNVAMILRRRLELMRTYSIDNGQTRPKKNIAVRQIGQPPLLSLNYVTINPRRLINPLRANMTTPIN